MKKSRLLAFEEVSKLNHMCGDVWLELADREHHKYELFPVFILRCTPTETIAEGDGCWSFKNDQYGSHWRCWSDRPSSEQTIEEGWT